MPIWFTASPRPTRHSLKSQDVVVRLDTPHRRNDLDRAEHWHTINSGGTSNPTDPLTEKGAKSG